MAAKPCDPYAKTITELAMVVASEPNVSTLDDVTAEMQKLLPEMNLTRDTIVASIVEATSGYSKALTDTQNKLNQIRREARVDASLRKKIADLEQHIKHGTLPAKTVRVDHSSETVRQLREIQSGIQKQIRKSEPAVKERLEKQIEELADRLENGVEILGGTKEDISDMSREIERLVYERDRKRAEINARIRAMQPRGFWGYVAEPLNLARAVMTSMDLSAVLRQGGFIAIGNPARASKSIVPMLRAFKSPIKAHAIHAEILNRSNAPKYDRAGLYLAPEDTDSLSKQEEAFMSRLAGKIPFVAGSQRAYNTFLNKLRADSFDAMVAMLARNGEPTLEEMAAIANYINIATGRGQLGKIAPAAVTLNTVFFAPRYVASRFQILAGQPFYGGNARTRKLIALEYAKMLGGLGIIYALAALAGGETEWDPRSSDFGKMKFGDTRIDPLMGLSQVTRLIARVGSGSKKTMKGEIVPIRGDKVPYRGETATGTIGSFLRSKLAPFPGAVLDVVSGENVVGERVTPLSAAAQLVTPISFGEIYATMQEHGVAKGTAFSLLSIFGMGLQNYGDARSEIEKDDNK